jgi:hypothetical protein
VHPASRLLAAVGALALAVTLPIACGQSKGFHQLPLRVEEVGDVPLSDIAEPPANLGDISSWRTTVPGQIFAAVKTEAPCPRDIHTMAGVKFRKDTIELCFSATPRSEPIPGFTCSNEVYVKYEIMGMPADVTPKFTFVGACVPTTQAQ